ncbi:hypothetical protein PQE66_gp146 [Bacillus phage PBC2]|uniref:Uncharacterized protein n=1 Tax=Bacillus phage PBC2 TaxID=1675029 RepID=A0A218KC51_9CAUD|nr:hypothetical protein PQE66_gp146 [Bacillus phage PBC2]AKQ08461.1 hypothetical protein PBC2_146 [Bacillus phage PBC2]
MRTKEEIYDAIVEWEQEAGEDFVDYFSGDMNEFNFMFWALGKKYINVEQLQAFEQETCPSTSFLLGDEKYSVVYDDGEDEDWEETYKASRRILADFLSSTITYQARLENFFKNIYPMKFEDALKEFRFKREKVFYVLDDEERVYLTNETMLTADIIYQARWYRDDN